MTLYIFTEVPDRYTLLKTHQVLHFAIWSAILHVCDVGESIGSVPDQFVHDSRDRLKVHIPGFHVMLAGHQP